MLVSLRASSQLLSPIALFLHIRRFTNAAKRCLHFWVKYTAERTLLRLCAAKNRDFRRFRERGAPSWRCLACATPNLRASFDLRYSRKRRCAVFTVQCGVTASRRCVLVLYSKEYYVAVEVLIDSVILQDEFKKLDLGYGTYRYPVWTSQFYLVAFGYYY